MDRYVKKYDGWTRLGPRRDNTQAQGDISAKRSNPAQGNIPAKKSNPAQAEPSQKKIFNEGPVNPFEEINMVQTGFLTSKAGKKFIRIEFTRQRKHGADTAEGILPGGKILKYNGFTATEVASLEFYLRHNKEEIVSRARELSNPLHWLA